MRLLAQKDGALGLASHLVDVAERLRSPDANAIKGANSLQSLINVLCQANPKVTAHGSVYLSVPHDKDLEEEFTDDGTRYADRAGCACLYDDKLEAYAVTTDVLTLSERARLRDLKLFCKPTRRHEPRLTLAYNCAHSDATFHLSQRGHSVSLVPYREEDGDLVFPAKTVSSAASCVPNMVSAAMSVASLLPWSCLDERTHWLLRPGIAEVQLVDTAFLKDWRELVEQCQRSNDYYQQEFAQRLLTTLKPYL